MQTTTYSFDDVETVISHPSVGQRILKGQGLGSISVTQATDKTAHNVAADGATMVSLVAGDNGTIAITIQQTSEANKWMRKWLNYAKSHPSEFADASITIRSPMMGDLVTASGVSPQKMADRTFAAQGEMVTWNLMAADIQQD